MKNLIRIGIIAGIILIIGFFVYVGTSPLMQTYSSFKNNLDEKTELSFSRVAMMPGKLGEKETKLMSFQMKTFGPGTITFGKGDGIKVGIAAKNNSTKGIPGNVGCILRDTKNPQITYASVSDWTTQIDGPGMEANDFELGDIRFSNFGEGENQTITLKPKVPLAVEIVCDTSNFPKSANPSTMSANILIPGSITYSVTDIVVIKNRYNTVGTKDYIKGLPIKGQELSTTH